MILMRTLGRASALPLSQGNVSSTAMIGGILPISCPIFAFPVDKLLLHSSHQTRTIFHQFHRQLHSFSQNYLPMAKMASSSSMFTPSHDTKGRTLNVLNSCSFSRIRNLSSNTLCLKTGKSVKGTTATFSTTSSPCVLHGANEESGTSPGKTITLALHNALLSQEQADNFLRHLSDDQKKILYHSLNIEVQRSTTSGHLGSTTLESANYLSKFGRPTAAIIGGKEEPPELLSPWLHTRPVTADLSFQQDQSSDEKPPPVTAKAIWAVGLKNAMPFIGFGFLDNLIMILAGDYIDLTIGAALGISTMAAAALGNTISDVAGIASAWYVEALAEKVGIHDPKLTPGQWNLWSVRWASNIGRAVGVVIGCLLGMLPLLFLPSAEEKKEREEAANALKETNKNKE